MQNPKKSQSLEWAGKLTLKNLKRKLVAHASSISVAFFFLWTLCMYAMDMSDPYLDLDDDQYLDLVFLFDDLSNVMVTMAWFWSTISLTSGRNPIAVGEALTAVFIAIFVMAFNILIPIFEIPLTSATGLAAFGFLVMVQIFMLLVVSRNETHDTKTIKDTL